MKLFIYFSFLSSIVLSVSSTGTRPEIVDSILPEVKQQGQIGYLNCSVINLNPSSAVLQWIKQTTPSGTPLLISSNEKIHVNDVVEGHSKYYVKKTVYNNKEQYQLVIRALTENDAGYYTCMIKLANQNYLQWPKKLGLLTVLSEQMRGLRYPYCLNVNPASGSLDQIKVYNEYDLNKQDDQR